MNTDIFSDFLNDTNPEIDAEVKFQMDVLDRIHFLLHKKFAGKQKLLAEAMGKSEAEVSKWLSGVQNFTTRTLIKLSIAFGESVIAVVVDHEDENVESRYVKGVHGNLKAQLSIEPNGILCEEFKS